MRHAFARREAEPWTFGYEFSPVLHSVSWKNQETKYWQDTQQRVLVAQLPVSCSAFGRIHGSFVVGTQGSRPHLATRSRKSSELARDFQVFPLFSPSLPIQTNVSQAFRQSANKVRTNSRIDDESQRVLHDEASSSWNLQTLPSGAQAVWL
jgi:hypothetical protein